jgi:hypothetical protein
MNLSEVLLLRTRGFINEIDPDMQAEIMEKGLKRINPKAPDFIVFDPKADRERIEDEGRSVILPSKAKDKVYVKLDDFGSAEALSEDCGFPVSTRFSVVFMLAGEY